MKSKILLSFVLIFVFLFTGCTADIPIEDTEEYQQGYQDGYDAGYEAALNDIEEDYETNPDSEYEPVNMILYYVDTQKTPLNIREEPFQESNILGQIPKGADIFISDFVDGFGYTCYKEIYGWVNLDYCKEGSSPNPPVAETSETVYVTDTGSKYHRDGCQYLHSSKNPISLEEAEKNYSPCSKCF